MTKKYKKMNNIILLLAIMLSLTAFTMSAKAYHIENVLSSWDHIAQIDSSTNLPFEYNTNETYIELHYTNGYTYTTSSQNTTSFWDYLGGIISRTHNIRTYSTY